MSSFPLPPSWTSVTVLIASFKDSGEEAIFELLVPQIDHLAETFPENVWEVVPFDDLQVLTLVDDE